MGKRLSESMIENAREAKKLLLSGSPHHQAICPTPAEEMCTADDMSPYGDGLAKAWTISTQHPHEGRWATLLLGNDSRLVVLNTICGPAVCCGDNKQNATCIDATLLLRSLWMVCVGCFVSCTVVLPMVEKW
jgi:hypothetical protein